MMNSKLTLPSFSIVLETENLASADIQGLVKAIAALAAQDPPPTLANEVLLIDSGDTPAELLDRLCDQYPWITVLPTPPGTGYYQAKMFGAAKATGEIIVYYDSDCLYQPHWLRTILTTFAQSNEIQIVAGETTTRGSGPYGTAMAIVYIFPQFSRQTKLKPTTQYFLNNVAFRRKFLLQNPIPTDLPLYRGHCVIHAHELQQQGYTIWQNPEAQTTHAPPNGLSHFFWRFLLIGHDYYWQKRLLEKAGAKPQTSTDPTPIGWRSKLQILDDRLGKLIRAQPIRFVWLPIALPIVFAAVTLIFIGYWITAIRPNFLLKTYNHLLGEN